MLNEDGTQETPEQASERENARLQAAKRIEDAKIEADRLSQLAERPKTPEEWVHRQYPGQPRYAITPPNTYEIDSFATGYRHADDPYHCQELDDAWRLADKAQTVKYLASLNPVAPATIAAAPIVLTPIPLNPTVAPAFGVQPQGTTLTATTILRDVSQLAAPAPFVPAVAPPVTPSHALDTALQIADFAEAHPAALSALVGILRSFAGLFGHGKAA